VFVTYPQSSLTAARIIEHFQSVKPIAWARVCNEKHQDGHDHQHVVCKFVTRLQTRNSRIFDIDGRHPKIEKLKSIKKALEYVSKDGEFVDHGDVPTGQDPDIDWMEVAATSAESEYYMQAARAKLPFQYAQKFWELGRKDACEIPVSYEAVLERECEKLRGTEPSEGTNVVIGPTGMGKTSWAKRVCKKPALWVRHIDLLRSFRPRYHKSIIFDDMSFTHLPRTSQIHIVDQTDEAHIHMRFKVAVIPEGTQKIFTANEPPFSDDPAINRRINHINLYDN